MTDPFENTPQVISATLRKKIDSIQRNEATEEQVSEFIWALEKGGIKDSSGKVLDAEALCHYLLEHEDRYLHHGFVSYFINAKLRKNTHSLVAICESHAKTSGLALFLLTCLDDRYQDVTQKFIVLKQAATLNNGNAMEELYVKYFPQGNIKYKDACLVTADEALKYLKGAASLGCSFASHELFKIYMGQGFIKAKINLKKAFAILRRAVPSANGEIEYELALMLEHGYRTIDGQSIPADPNKAELFLANSALKSSANRSHQKLKRQLRFKEYNLNLPLEIKDALFNIRLVTQSKQDIKNLVSYLQDQTRSLQDIKHFLIFLIKYHIIYLPPDVFSTLSQKVKSFNERTEKSFEQEFVDCSPLIESLFYPKSLSPIQCNNPHAEYTAYRLYRFGGAATHEKIGKVNSGSVTIQRDLELAAIYLQRAAENGHAEAQFLYGQQLLDQKKEFFGLKYLVLASAQFHEGATYVLADYHWRIFTANRNVQAGRTALLYFSSLVGSGITEKEFSAKSDQVREVAADIRASIGRKIDRLTLFSEDIDDDQNEINEYSPLLDYMLSPTRPRY